MKVLLVCFALVACSFAFPQHRSIIGRDFSQNHYQDDSGQLSQSYVAPGISRTDEVKLVPDGRGDFYPVHTSRSHHIAPNGENVIQTIIADLLGARITGSHVPTA